MRDAGDGVPEAARRGLRAGRTAFLLESAENSEQIGRYSFLGSRPAAVFESHGRTVTVTEQSGARRQRRGAGDPLAELQTFSRATGPRPTSAERAVRRWGGRVTWVTTPCGGSRGRYRRTAGTTRLARDRVRFTDPMIVFDHVPAAARAGQRVHRRPRRSRPPRTTRPARKSPGSCAVCARRATCGRGWFTAKCPRARAREQHHARGVRGDRPRGQEYIRAGDIFQFVPSQRFRTEYKATRSRSTGRCGSSTLRRTCSLPVRQRISLVGSSPEMHVRARTARWKSGPSPARSARQDAERG